MSNINEITAGTGLVAAAVAAWRFLRSAAGRKLVGSLRKAAVSETQSLREAIDNLSQVVSAQGDSIEWLRNELDRTRIELTEARVALTAKESKLEVENDLLRERVAELEAQVKALETALAARKRRTTKKVEDN
jgi:septal ring factor EnvC (AmiA/AmiB activator)